MKEGWTKIVNLDSKRETGKLHYFSDGSSLCGKYFLCSSMLQELKTNAWIGSRMSRRLGCVICRRLLRKGEISELEKHSQTVEQRKTIEEFLDWLNEGKILLGSYIKLYEDSDTEEMAPILQNRQELLDEYFNIDPVQLEKERRELLEQARKQS